MDIVIDLHCHILPGIDDGPADLEEAVALARATVEAGIDTVVATPHVSSRYPNRPEGVHRALEGLHTALQEADVPLTVLPGAEIALDQLADLDDDELRALALGGGPYLLLEAPLSASAGDAEPLLRSAVQRGFRVLLGHPERSPQFQRDPTQLQHLAGAGVLMSLTAGSLSGEFGDRARRLSVRAFREGLVHNLASDMHDVRRRPPGIAGPVAAATDLGAEVTAQLPWLAGAVPAAILDGGRLPPMPAPPRPAPSRQWPWARLRARTARS
ncbi:MAG TPA: CpsB/CapC family capsule biosynthesis tyrosine phosphatase [Baekduia sp.]|jgi:protein-tyrosine phosphatase|nr:CpsB/CapC family capsule biosynthesis tyrosine phosphatase [Baekduia sp.]